MATSSPGRKAGQGPREEENGRREEDQQAAAKEEGCPQVVSGAPALPRADALPDDGRQGCV